MPHVLRTGITDFLDMPEADLRVLAPAVGGAFGQKVPLFPEYVLHVRHSLKRLRARSAEELVSLIRKCH
jgi:carbon-monoxide dehydrogenase large subunit